MLQNAYLLAKIGADTAENEQHFAEILPIGRRGPSQCKDAQADEVDRIHEDTQRRAPLPRTLPLLPSVHAQTRGVWKHLDARRLFIFKLRNPIFTDLSAHIFPGGGAGWGGYNKCTEADQTV